MMQRNEIRKIAKISIEAIIRLRKKDSESYTLNFTGDEIDLQKEIDCSDLKKAKENGSQPFEYFRYFIWGLEMGFWEIEPFASRKSLAERIVEGDRNSLWEGGKPHVTDFLYIVEEKVLRKDGSENSAITVYELTFDQWVDLKHLSLDKRLSLKNR